MALLAPNGNYLKINNIRYWQAPANATGETANVTILFDIYKTAESRTNGVGEFETVKHLMEPFISFRYIYDDTLSLKENMITGAYVTLKLLYPYSTWEDA
jgi:hypothetical protein